MIGNSLFEETNEHHIFSKVFYNKLRFKFLVYNLSMKMKNPSIKNFSLREIYNNRKKLKIYDFAHVINCIRKLTCVCTFMCVHAIECISGNSVLVEKRLGKKAKVNFKIHVTD